MLCSQQQQKCWTIFSIRHLHEKLIIKFVVNDFCYCTHSYFAEEIVITFTVTYAAQVSYTLRTMLTLGSPCGLKSHLQMKRDNLERQSSMSEFLE